MSFIAPSIDDLVAQQVAVAQSSLEVFVAGQRGQPDLTEGSDLMTQIENQALLIDFFNQGLAQFYINYNYNTATGVYLDAILATRGLFRIPAGYAVVPVLCTCDPAQIVTIPAGYRFMAADATGQLTIPFDALADPSLPANTAAVKPVGASTVWVLAMAEQDALGTWSGTIGNVAAGAIGGVGSAQIAGLLGVSNPPVQSTAAPTAVAMGATGSLTAQYAVVAKGRQGYALQSATGTVTNAASILTSVNYVALSVQPVDNAYGYDWLKLVNNVWMLLGSTAVGVTSLNDTGQTPQSSVTPTVNNANMGLGGTNLESDVAFRARADQQQQASGSGTDDALIRAAIGITNVTQAFVQDGAVAGTATLSYVATLNPLPPLLASQLGTAVDTAAAAGAVITVQQILPTPVTVAYTYVASANPPSNLIEQINAAITAFFLTLAPGQTIHDSVLSAAMQAVTGVDHIPTRIYTVQGGASYTNSDVPGQTGVLYGSGQIIVTIGG